MYHLLCVIMSQESLADASQDVIGPVLWQVEQEEGRDEVHTEMGSDGE